MQTIFQNIHSYVSVPFSVGVISSVASHDLFSHMPQICFSLTHWPLREVEVISKILFSNSIALRWMQDSLSNGRSILDQVMAWCRPTTSHYLVQCWPRYISPYGVTKPLWVRYDTGIRIHHWSIYFAARTITIIMFPKRVKQSKAGDSRHPVEENGNDVIPRSIKDASSTTWNWNGNWVRSTLRIFCKKKPKTNGL